MGDIVFFWFDQSTGEICVSAVIASMVRETAITFYDPPARSNVTAIPFHRFLFDRPLRSSTR